MAASWDAASWRPIFQSLTARGATDSAKAAALALLNDRLRGACHLSLIAPVACKALDEGVLDALVEVLRAPSAGRQARVDAALLVGVLSLAAAAFKRAVAHNPGALAAVARLIDQPDVNRQPGDDLQRDAKAVLLSVTAESPQACRAAAEAGAVPALVACIGEGASDDDLRVAAMSLFGGLIAGSTNRATAAAAAGAVPALCRRCAAWPASQPSAGAAGPGEGGGCRRRYGSHRRPGAPSKPLC
jgi:hypothetical protein